MYDVPVDRTVDELEVSKQHVWNVTSKVRKRVEAMRETLELIDSEEIPTPNSCVECGNSLSTWTIGSDGRPLCPGCGGIDPKEILPR